MTVTYISFSSKHPRLHVNSGLLQMPLLEKGGLSGNHLKVRQQRDWDSSKAIHTLWKVSLNQHTSYNPSQQLKHPRMSKRAPALLGGGGCGTGKALTIPSAGSPGSHGVMENPVHPHQKPAYTKAQQKSQHQINLLFGYIIGDKVILRGVHHRLVSVVRNNIMDVMPVGRTNKETQSAGAKQKTFVVQQPGSALPGLGHTLCLWRATSSSRKINAFLVFIFNIRDAQESGLSLG